MSITPPLQSPDGGLPVGPAPKSSGCSAAGAPTSSVLGLGGLLLLLASSSATGRAARLAALAATAFALVAVPYAAYESRQQSGLFGAGNALGSDEPSGELYLPAPRTDMGHPLPTSPADASANTNSGP